jgi:hypothetical protein
MKPARSKPPGRFLPIAAYGVGVLALSALAGIEFGLIESPIRDDPSPRPVAPAKPDVRAEAIRRPEPDPRPSQAPGSETLPIVVHDEQAAEPPARATPPGSPARLTTEGKAKIGSDLGKADKDWRQRLGLLHRRMHNRGVDAGAVARKAMLEIEEITDPKAAPALWHVFAGHPAHHRMVAGRLAKLESPRSSLLLAALAAYSPDEKARRTAVDALKSRDPVEFAAPLIALLGPELKYRMGSLPTGPGEPILQALEIEDERFIKQFVYFAGERPAGSDPGAFGDFAAMPCEVDPSKAQLTQELADFQLRCDVEAVETLNLRIRTLNDRAHTALTESTGRDYRLDRDAWYGWLASKSGKTYVPPAQVAKVPLRDFVEPIYVPTFVEVPPVPS